jgi:hypothetical protein
MLLPLRDRLSKAELAFKLAKHQGYASKHLQVVSRDAVGRPMETPACLRLDVSRLREVFSVKLTSFEDILAQTFVK